MEEVQGGGTLARGASTIARLEAFYLAALRILSLLLATILIVYAIWLGISGAYGLTRDASAVTPQPVEITAKEVAAIPSESVESGSTDPAQNPLRTEKAFYKNFTDRYYRVYDERYQAFRKENERKLSRAAFDERFVGTTRRLAALSEGDLSASEDRARLERLLAVMTQVAELPETVNRLERYKRSRRVQISRIVSSTRSERYCSYYGYYIDQCISYDTREVPYKRTVTESRLPKGVYEPAKLFEQHQEQFLSLLASRTEQNATKAQEQRDRIIEGNVIGSAKLGTATQLLGAFLVVMFLFLLIAIERHQRRLAIRQA